MSLYPWTAGAALFLAGCGGEHHPAPTPAPELGPVVRERLAALERQLGAPQTLPELGPEGLEEVDGLVTMLASSKGALRQLALEAIGEDVGPAAIGRLSEHLVDSAREATQRLAAAELLGVLDHPRAAELLLQQVEQASESWMRSWCAWYLGDTTQDQVLPRLLRRLRYEKDPDTFLWLGRALLHFENYAGLAALEDLARRGVDETQRGKATELLQAAAGRAGVERDQLAGLWSSQRAEELPQPTPSARLRREVWKLVDELSEEHFQLRGVDDARHVLSNMGPWVAREIASALGDTDAHVRLHTAQVLERMGPRAVSSGPALLAALADPRLAPAAAEALGRVGYPPAVPALAARSAPGQSHELRVAALRALGRTGLAQGLPSLRAAFRPDTEPTDLCQAAATAMVLLDAGDEVAPWLARQLADPLADGEGAELALETWLWRGSQGQRRGFGAALEVWRARAGPPGVIPTLDQVRQRLDERGQLLVRLLPQLLQDSAD
jgi:HEAT repeat protein